MNCCDEYCSNYGCRQGRDCPVRVAKVGYRYPKYAQPLPESIWRKHSKALAKPTCKQSLQVAEQQEPVAWMVYTLDGKSVCVTDNPADFTDEHRALPLYTQPFPTDEALLRQALDALAYWLEHGETPGSHDIIQRTHDALQERLK